MKEKIKTFDQLPDLYGTIIELALRFGYWKVGNKFNDRKGECVIVLDDLTVFMHSDVPLIVVKEIGLAVRKSKRREVSLFLDGAVVTPKQIKMLVEMERQTA
ncbi:hypothetical protein ALQ37_200036 [Pseudomonas syringae pv. aptata]|uniref:Uncharacterized protein n=1 Tax=Pseudomonas syringae pv. aptata TaxID=83167 RepID=A0A0Q0DJ09_PSEAP|nr:hypothetical protein [Pseudomonas syringae]KPY97975.1 Unknown protein sequence [Pseudomonas syringae pv. aptata]RMO65440.1 hypothetical protein ALQ37_200036 [Pseudomonas syringae pv. aptata]